jgi:hypothetical protein
MVNDALAAALYYSFMVLLEEQVQEESSWSRIIKCSRKANKLKNKNSW